MNRWSYRQKALVGGCVTDGVICPKPRRIGLPLQFQDPVRPQARLIYINNQQADAYDSKSGTVFLDVIRSKGNCGSDRSHFQVASSPPFFTGSPPSRASNPVIKDEQFGNDNGNPLPPSLEAPSVPSASSRRSAPMRIEGFNCRESCSISAVA